MRSPYVVTLTVGQKTELEALSRRLSAPYRQVLRARIVLAAAAGESNASTARRLAVCEDTVRRWRRRFCRSGIEGLTDRPRSGRPRVYPASTVAQIKALARELPSAQECHWPAGAALNWYNRLEREGSWRVSRPRRCTDG